MKKDERWWGACGTAVYLGGWILVVAARHEEFFNLKLNELGDFLAGSFGPLAFAWLVMGYLQQGKELNVSSTALKMQADELRESVKQQSAMAAAHQENLKNYERTLEPLLELKDQGDTLIEGDYHAHLMLENYGGYCDEVKLTVFKDDVLKLPLELDRIYPSGKKGFFIYDLYDLNTHYRIEVGYKRINGGVGRQIFDLERYENEDGAGLVIKKRAQV